MNPRKIKQLALFSYNPESKQYDTRFQTTFHIPEQMDDHFSMEEAREFLAEPESQLTQYYKRFPLNSKLLRSRSVMIYATLMKIPILIFGLSLVITSSTIEDKQANLIVTIILSTLLGITFLMTTALLCVSYSRIQARKKHSFKVVENIQAHIQETYSYYQRKDLIWTVCKYGDLISMNFDPEEPKEPEGHHIELWKYDSMQDQPNENYEPQQQRQQQDFRRSAGRVEEFEFNIDVRKFANTYSPLWTEDQVSFEEVKQFLDLATPSFLQYNQSIDSIWSVGKWGVVGYVLLQIFNLAWAWDRVDRLYLAIGSFAYVSIATITMLCYIKNWYKKDGAIIPNIQAIIEQTDSQLKAKGYRWVLSERYYKSVQLWKDESPQMELFQDLEMQGPRQLPAQLNAHMYEALENKDEEFSQGLEHVQTQDNLSLLGQNAEGQDAGGQDARADSLLEFLRQQMDIVFYYDKKFLTHHYFPGLTNNKVSTDEIRTFLTEIELRFALYRRTCFGRFFQVYKFILCFAAFAIYIIFISCFPYPPGLVAMALLMPVLVVLVFVWGCLFRVDCSRMEKQMSEVILQRSSEYEQKGLKWVIPDKKYPPIIMLRDKNATSEPYIPM